MKIAAVLLAAGRASRFGAPKLAARLGGRAVCAYAAGTLVRLPLANRIAVVAAPVPGLVELGFDCVPLEPAGAPLSRSIALGVERAITSGAQAVLIALADMPLVPLTHFEALLAQFDGFGIATRSNERVMPPALFGPELLPLLGELQGDTGARALLQELLCVELSAELALDIDTPADLAQAERMLMRGLEIR